MSDLRLEREFRTSPGRLFRAVSTQGEVMQWWGPEGMFIPDGALDFTKVGPWYSVMQNTDGKRFKVSGQVTHVDAPNSVGFTWAWHDDQDHRGAESHVTFTVEPTGTGARLILQHRNLDDSEQSASHEAGWVSSLRKLAQHLT
jgi:uncharacterized protein YndB with AHSA1/START domain